MIGRWLILLVAVGAAVGAAMLGRRKARQMAAAKRRARRKAKGRGGADARSAAPARSVAPARSMAPARSVAPAQPETVTPSASAAPPPEVAASTQGAAAAFGSIKGIGPAIEERLRANDVTSVAQIAAWSDADVEALAPLLKVKPERIRREGWVAQAQAAASDEAR